MIKSLLIVTIVLVALIIVNAQKIGDGTFNEPNGKRFCGTEIKNEQILYALPDGYLNQVGCGNCLEVSNDKGNKVVLKVLCFVKKKYIYLLT